MQPKTEPPKGPSRILQLAETMEDEDIAFVLGLSIETVQQHLKAAQHKRRKWCVRCNRTNRVIRAGSQRGAYRLVCLMGLTDWEWWPEGQTALPGPEAAQ